MRRTFVAGVLLAASCAGAMFLLEAAPFVGARGGIAR